MILYEDNCTLNAEKRRYDILLVSVMNKQMLFTEELYKTPQI